MDSRGTWPPPSSHSQQQQPRPGMFTSPNPFLRNPNPNPAAFMMGAGSTSTSQSSSHQYHRLPFGAFSLPNQHRQPQRTLGSIVFGDGPHFQSQQVEKRRPGRPRKFSDEHYIVSPLLSVSDSYGGGNSNGGGNANSSDQPAKRSIGRPRGAKRQQLEALGTEGIGFIPHVVKVKTGEDIATKLREFSEQGPRTISILSGTGTVGKVTLRHSSSVTATYEGQYEIVTLAGSFLNCEVNGRMSRIGSLNVALAGNDGRVIGGGVIGELVAATDVQVVVGSFLVEPNKQKKSSSSQSGLNAEGSSDQANVNPFASPCSQGPSCDSTGDNESSSHPLQQPNNMSSSNRGTSSGHSAPQQYHHQQQQRQQQEQQQRQHEQEQRWQQQEQEQRQQQKQQQQQQEQEQRWQQQEQQQWQQQQEQGEQQIRRGFHIHHSIQMYDL